MKGETTNMISCDVYVLDLKQEWENVLTVLPFQTYLLMFMPLPHLRLLYVGCTYKVIYIVSRHSLQRLERTLNSLVSPFTFVSWIESLICVTSLLFSVSHWREYGGSKNQNKQSERVQPAMLTHVCLPRSHSDNWGRKRDQRQNIGKRGSRIERAKKSKERNAKRGDRTNETYDRKTKYRLALSIKDFFS